MPVLNKPDLVALISEKTGESKASTERFINALKETVVDAVADGTEVKISGFFACRPVVRSARTMKSPSTGEDIAVPETRAVSIKPLKHFKDAVADKKD